MIKIQKIVGVAVVLVIVGVLAMNAHIPQNDSSYSVSDIPASLEVTSSVSSQIEVGDVQDITWNSFNYTSQVVGINVIREVGTNPHRYELVRSLKGTISNDGKAVWVPTYKDIGDNVIIEVACKNTLEACTSDRTSSRSMVINSDRYTSLAQAFESFEMLRNN